MNPKIEKLEKKSKRPKAKIAEQQARLQDLEKQKTELENTDFVAVARSYHLTPQELAEFLKNAADGVRPGHRSFAAGTGGSA